MSGSYRGVAAAVFALALLAPPIAGAQEDVAVAIVNGEPITTSELAIAAEDMGSDLERIPEQLRATVLVDILINQRLLAEHARGEGVEDSDAYRRRMEYFTEQSLRDSLVETVMITAISEDDVRERYETEIAELPVVEEVSARHILVTSEAKAATIARLARDTDVDFAALASANSTGPSAARGGDLGYFTAEQMFEEFSKAAFALEIGEISDPVETSAGWHVIKLEDRRDRPPPALESVHDQIKALVLRDAIRTLTAELREGAEIEFPHEAGEGPAPAEADQEPAPAEAQ